MRKDLEYYKNNAEENYITTPISVLKYINELENMIENKSYNQKELNEILDSLDNKAYSMIRSWLFDKANGFAPDHKALHLHQANECLANVIEEVEPDYFVS